MVAVVAEAAPAVEDKRALLAVPSEGVCGENVVKPKGGVCVGGVHPRGALPLLPVEPPEIHPLPLKRCDGAGEEGGHSGLVL